MSFRSDTSLQRLLDAFAEPSPAPGGGSAAALAAATGASLLIKAATIAATPTKAATDSASLHDVVMQLQSARRGAIDAIDRDAEAYSAVVAARRMPSGTATEVEIRRRRTAEAMRGATEAPLDTLQASRQALGAAPVVAAQCTDSTSSDVRVAIELLRAAAHGAATTVAANLPYIADADYTTRIDAERQRLEFEADADAQSAAALLDKRRRS